MEIALDSPRMPRITPISGLVPVDVSRERSRSRRAAAHLPAGNLTARISSSICHLHSGTPGCVVGIFPASTVCAGRFAWLVEPLFGGRRAGSSRARCRLDKRSPGRLSSTLTGDAHDGGLPAPLPGRSSARAVWRAQRLLDEKAACRRLCCPDRYGMSHNQGTFTPQTLHSKHLKRDSLQIRITERQNHRH